MQNLLNRVGTEIFNRNMAVLEQRLGPGTGQWLSSLIIPGNFDITGAGEGTCLRVRLADRTLTFHSPRDPDREARLQADAIVKPDSQTGFIYGFGLGYVVEAVLRKMAPGGTLFVWDLNPAPFAVSMASRDLTTALSDPRLWLFAGGNFEVGAGNLERLFEFIRNEKESGFIYIHRPSLELIPENDASTRDLIQTIGIESASRNRWNDDLLANIQAFQKRESPDPGVERLFGIATGIPAVVIGAGPSLDANVHQLCPVRKSMLLIATDGAWLTLANAGLDPHIIITLDAQRHVCDHFKDFQPSDSVLVYSVTSPPCVSAVRAKSKFVMVPEKARNARDLFPGMGILTTGGTVGLAAVDLAVRMGADPVILTGMDLAFTGGRTHTGFSAFKSHGSGSGSLEVPAWGGGAIRTIPAFKIFLNRIADYIKAHAEVRFFDATEGGVHIPGCEDIPFARAAVEFQDMPQINLQ